MNRFAPALRKIALDLDLPKTARAAILLEMAADLDAIYEHHRRAGASEEEAARRAEETVLCSSGVVRHLASLHHGSWRGWSDNVGARLSGGADVVLLAIGVVPMLLMAGTVAARTLAHPVNPLTWGLIAVGITIAGIIAVEAGRLIGGGRGRARGLPLLLVLSAVAPSLGMLALVLGLHATSMVLLAGTPDAATQAILAAQVGRGGTLLAIGLLLGIAGCLSWFVLLNRASVQAAQEVDAMLEDHSQPAPHPRSAEIVPLVRRRRA